MAWATSSATSLERRMAAKRNHYLEQQLCRRLEFVKGFRNIVSENGSVASRAVAELNEILNEALLDIVVEAHKLWCLHLGGYESDCTFQRAQCKQNQGLDPFVDAFRHSNQASCPEMVTCAHCNRKVTASRFVPHLEKCMGRGRNMCRN